LALAGNVVPVVNCALGLSRAFAGDSERDGRILAEQ
jgi:hypothetical protein